MGILESRLLLWMNLKISKDHRELKHVITLSYDFSFF